MKRILIFAASILLCFSGSAGAYKPEKSLDIYPAQDIVIDGKLDDWDKHKYSYQVLPETPEQVSYFEAYEGPDDLSAVFWYAWSDAGLYMAARVTDNIEYTVEGTGYWKGDSVQLAPGVGNSYGPELGFSAEGIVYRGSAKNAVDGPENVVLKTEKEGNVRIYEVFFPWGTISSGKPEEYIPFCVILNENEGDGRKGWVEFAPGISTTKSANEFGILKFSGKEPELNTGEPIRPVVKDLTAKEEVEEVQTIVYEVKTYITYPDIKFHWARTAIDNMASRGIVRGYGEFYNPSWNSTRAEFIATLVRAVGLDTVSYQGGFGDIGADHWCADYIQAAVEGELLPKDFYANGIRPDENITREEMFAMFCNALLKRKNLPMTSAKLTYSDSGEISVWIMPYIRCAQQYGLISGNGTGMLCPKNPATRAEIAVMADRFVEMTQ